MKWESHTVSLSWILTEPWPIINHQPQLWWRLCLRMGNTTFANAVLSNHIMQSCQIFLQYPMLLVQELLLSNFLYGIKGPIYIIYVFFTHMLRILNLQQHSFVHDSALPEIFTVSEWSAYGRWQVAKTGRRQPRCPNTSVNKSPINTWWEDPPFRLWTLDVDTYQYLVFGPLSLT